MKRLFAVSVAAFGVFLACSPGERIAGSKGGSETTNGVTACVYRSDGAPAAGSIVRLRPADYLSPPPATGNASPESADVPTDARGRFTVAGMRPGAYCIEVNDTAGGGGAVLFRCAVGAGDTVDLGSDSLRPYATMTGAVDTAETGGRRLYAHIRGLERRAPVGGDGSFAFYDLPAGNLKVRIGDDAGGFTAKEISNVRIAPGDTVAVTVAGKSVFSGYVYLDAAPAGPLTDFPLLIRLDSAAFDFTQAGPGGEDMRFTTAGGTPLAHEIERWDPSSGRAEVWVRIDTVRGAGAEQFIIMKWGDAAAKDQSNGTIVFDTAQGFAGVWHFNENPGAGANAVRDRTANGYDATAEGSMTGGSVVSGMIGAALSLDGLDDHVTAGPLNLSGSYTLSCWIYADDLGSAGRFIWKEFSYTLWYDAIGGGIRVEHFTDSLVWRGIYQDNFRLAPLNAKTWYYIACTFDGDRIRLYVDGEPRDSTRSIGANPHSSREPLSLGGRSGEFVKGVMDEVRIENKARSADWIMLCYRNQKRPPADSGRFLSRARPALRLQTVSQP